jgi:hypothetical protein
VCVCERESECVRVGGYMSDCMVFGECESECESE